MEAQILMIGAIFLVAILYSSVGHGGASGYLAVMAFFAVAPAETRPTALILNLFVASIGTLQFYRRGHFNWKIFLSFAATSTPFAFVGGMIHLPVPLYKKFLAACLLFAAFRLAWKFTSDEREVQSPPVWIALAIGAAVGLLSGLIGVGGGIFLTPILLLLHWTDARTAAGISAMFIFVNSAAGLGGNFAQAANLPPHVVFWIMAAVVGGVIGSTLGSKHFNTLTLRRALAVVLVLAGVKLLFE